MASLAIVFPGDKQVHHLIVESLATDNDTEFKCACNAMSAFAELSPYVPSTFIPIDPHEFSEFSSTIIHQIGDLLRCPNTTVARKSLIVPIFGHMKAEVKTTQVLRFVPALIYLVL